MIKKVLYYDDMTQGQEFKPFVYTMKEDAIIKYCRAVGETSSIFNSLEEAKIEGYPALVAPQATAATYAYRGFLDEVRMPPGSSYATQGLEFLIPVLAGDVLTTTSRILSKFESRGRKHVIIEAATKNQNGQMVVRSQMDVIWAE